MLKEPGNYKHGNALPADWWQILSMTGKEPKKAHEKPWRMCNKNAATWSTTPQQFTREDCGWTNENAAEA
ncbi:hypothetical protein MPTK1_7g12780 [Marchantia polymorpha subsp. ruderalis]|uniref:Uncharacterized protein n=2 Tax=Marchantia polymorpha TaxID=3197 RepID=A0AAF6BYX2_MARPO|nr:hypothetical protein MARPO_0003s0286 [Marchantia polymorpha]BBN17206.1 hypothetical protein Mp_7g12780 [Marchantia polymorpha subsp. ruderalis]|eukprot:PTQ49441.1 hypothetical protein MARPO_0003s0286 [Marchantia polymorpha]